MKDNDEINRQSEPLNLDQADCSHAEGQVTRALGTLRLLVDKDNPLSLREAIARARELAEGYACWEGSGALIKDLAVRLSDGQEIAVDQSNIASVCGLRFRNVFPADAVLHIWKKADEQFGEVQLLSLPLRDVRASGYNNKKTYKNGQTLLLRVDRCLDGQFDINVDYTEKERAMVMPSRHYSWLLVLGSAVTLALSKLASIFSSQRPRPRPRLPLQPTAAFIGGLAVATVVCCVTLFALGRVAGSVGSFSVRLTTANPEDSNPGHVSAEHACNLPGTETMEVGQATESLEAKASDILERPAVTETSSKVDQLEKIGFTYEMPASSTKKAHGVSFPAAKVAESTTDSDHEGQARQRAWPSDSRETASWIKKKQVTQNLNKSGDTVADSQTVVYIKTDSKDHTVSDKALRIVFVGALERTKHFVIADDAKEPHQAGWVIDVRFASKRDKRGVLLVELYNDKGQLLWNGDQNCSKFASGTQLETATQQLVDNMLSKVTSSQAEDSGGE